MSIGVVPIDSDGDSATAILQRADSACYAAKDAGRNRVRVYTHGDSELLRRQGEMQWVARLTRALDEDQFVLVGQRIASLKAGHRDPERYEFLVRLRVEDGSLIAPGVFLPAAERYDLATRLDEWVVAHAVHWLAAHPDFVERMDYCALNLSGQTVGDETVLERLIDLICRHPSLAHKLCFEVTETAAIASLANAGRFIDRCRAMGCRFALDDFGSGLSSFAYLKRLPVDYLKIDGMFVKNMVEDPVDLEMVSAINDIGHVMGKRTIAEFVENEAIAERLRALGVDFAQGYGIAKPAPLDDLLAATYRLRWSSS